MSAIASQITSLTLVYSTCYSGVDQRKHQSSTSLAFVRGIHRWPVNSPHKWPVTRKMFPFDDVIMQWHVPKADDRSTHMKLDERSHCQFKSVSVYFFLSVLALVLAPRCRSVLLDSFPPIVPHICVSELGQHWSSKGLPPVRRQAITWTNADLLSNGPLGTNFSEIRIEIRNILLMKRIWNCRLRNCGHFVQGERNEMKREKLKNFRKHVPCIVHPKNCTFYSLFVLRHCVWYRSISPVSFRIP